MAQQQLRLTVWGLFLANPVDAAIVVAHAMAGHWPALTSHPVSDTERQALVQSGNVLAFVENGVMGRWREGRSCK
jgi:hypothetical protein